MTTIGQRPHNPAATTTKGRRRCTSPTCSPGATSSSSGLRLHGQLVRPAVSTARSGSAARGRLFVVGLQLPAAAVERIRQLPGRRRRDDAVSHRGVEQPGRGQGGQPLLRDLPDRQLDAGAPADAEPRPALRARQRLRAGILPDAARISGGRPFPGGLLRQAAVQCLELASRRALHASWDIAGNGKTVLKGRLGPVRSPAATGARNGLGRPAGPDDGDLPLARFQRQRHLRCRRGQPEHQRCRTSSRSPAAATPCRARTNGSRRATRSRCRSSASWRRISACAPATSTRAITTPTASLNTLRPYAAYNVPVTRPDPGPDGAVGTADDPGVTSPTTSGDRAERPRLRAVRPGQRPGGGSDLQQHRHRAVEAVVAQLAAARRRIRRPSATCR